MEAPTGERRRRQDRGPEGAEGGRVCGGGIPLRSRLGGLRERGELPQRDPGRSPGRKRVLSIFYGHRTALAQGKMRRFA